MKFKKLAAVLLAVVMVFTFAACASPDVKWIADVDGENIPSGVYLSLMIQAYSDATDLAADPEADPRKQEIEGKPGSQWIQEKTDELFARYIAVEKQAKEKNIVFDAATKAGLAQQIQSQWQFLGPVYEENGISFESYTAVTENAYKSTLIFHATYGKDGTNAIPEAELLKTFQDTFYKVQYTTMSLTDSAGKGLDEAGQKAVMDKANALLAQATAPNADFAKVILDYEVALAVENGQDVSNMHEHDETAHISYVNDASTSYEKEYLDAVSSMKTDEVRVFTVGASVYVLKRLDNSKSTAEAMEDYRTTVMDKLKGEEYNAAKKSWADAVVVNYHAESKAMYTPSKLKL